MTNIKIPKYFMGKEIAKEGKEAYERLMKGEDKPIQTPIANPIKDKPDLNDFIYVPSINLYVAKQRTHLNKNWYDCHKELQKDNQRMLIIPEFIEFLKYLKSQSNNQEYKNIYNEITEVRAPWRAEWLDANFKKKKDGLYILTENETKEEKLEDCLMQDKLPGISLDDYIMKNHTNQGLPTKKVSSGNLYYWKPKEDNNSVAGFGANDDRAYLGCGRGPSDADSYLGVRVAKEKK